MILNTIQWPNPPNPENANAVFLHGMGGTAQLWRPIAATLENSINCVALDQRGHGESQLPYSELATARFTPLEYGQDIVETLRALRLRKSMLIGHSMGVRTAISAAYLAPELVSGLILIDLGLSGPAGGGMGQVLRDFLVALPEHFTLRADLRNYVMANCPDPSIGQYLIAVSKPLAPGQFGFPFDRAALISTIDATRDTSVRSWALALAQQQIPLLFLRGEKSNVWTASQMEQEKEAFAAFPKVQWITLPDCGHGLPFEKRKEFCELVTQFTQA